jgi:threonine dehydrogenase-like Zn-dependent dehydrogenase
LPPCLPFQIFCGGCYFCTRGLTACCDNTNPATDRAKRYLPVALPLAAAVLAVRILRD